MKTWVCVRSESGPIRNHCPVFSSFDMNFLSWLIGTGMANAIKFTDTSSWTYELSALALLAKVKTADKADTATFGYIETEDCVKISSPQASLCGCLLWRTPMTQKTALQSLEKPANNLSSSQCLTSHLSIIQQNFRCKLGSKGTI